MRFTACQWLRFGLEVYWLITKTEKTRSGQVSNIVYMSEPTTD